jgi:hypothetical protein
MRHSKKRWLPLPGGGSAFSLTNFSGGEQCRISRNRNAARLRIFFLPVLRPRRWPGILAGVTPPSTGNSNGIGLRKIRTTGRTPITASSAGNATSTKSAIFHRQAVWENAVAAESFHATSIVRILRRTSAEGWIVRHMCAMDARN